jgi:hypothetical protein
MVLCIVFVGSVQSMPAGILKQIPIPASHDTIVLLDWMSEETEMATTRQDNSGWPAGLEGSSAAEWADGLFRCGRVGGGRPAASTWSCCRVTVDVDSGAIAVLYFTK